MRLIPLAGGKLAKVDDCDFEWLNSYKWGALKSGYTWYAFGKPRSELYKRPATKRVLMHTLVAGFSNPDHKDRDGLNNTRDNLRRATKSQNAANVAKKKWSGPQTLTTSRFKGVRRRVTNGSPRNRWLASITVNYKNKHLGTFGSEEEAALAYDAAAVTAFGEYARLNFKKQEVAA